MRNLFKDFTRADAIKAQEERVKARVRALDLRRLSEHEAILDCPGEGCAFCIDGAKSDSTAAQIDICREQYAYLPLFLDINNQRPAWCRGFERNGTGVVPATTQEELAL
jgi:hypothetical protein